MGAAVLLLAGVTILVDVVEASMLSHLSVQGAALVLAVPMLSAMMACPVERASLAALASSSLAALRTAFAAVI